jgi:Sulfotransferase domain
MTRMIDFFVVGAPKCATTAVHAYLRGHPEIFMPAQKELHFFGSDLSKLPSQLTEEQHRQLFVDAGDARRVGETCIWALYSREAARSIHDYNPAARIVIMLRNPVEMLHALHAEYLIHGIEDIAHFAGALEAQDDRQKGKRLPLRGMYPTQLYAYHAIGRFSEQVERYLKVFGRDRVHVVLYEDFKADPSLEYGRLLRFLGVSADPRPDFKVINPSRVLRSCALQRVLVSSASLTRGWPRSLLPMPERHRSKLGQTLARWNLRVAPRPLLDSRLRVQLQTEFAADIVALGELLRRDLKCWLEPRERVVA